MKGNKTIRNWIVRFALAIAPLAARGQSMDNIQVHGFATQGFLFSHGNNFLVPNSDEGTLAWTDAAFNITDQPTEKLRIGMQLHFDRLGDNGDDNVFVDWAFGDYQVNRYFGLRAGKVKTPIGLFNAEQDVDAVFLWALLPQGAYQVDNTSFFLSHLGAEVYGSVSPGKAGRISYRVYDGTSSLSTQGGYLELVTDVTGLVFDAAPAAKLYGADLRWQTPLKPLMAGISGFHTHVMGTAVNGSIDVKATMPVYYAQYDSGQFYMAGEYRRIPIHVNATIGPYPIQLPVDQRVWYVMTAYRPAKKLQVGTYYSCLTEPNRDRSDTYSNSKDLVFSARYDFNDFFYAKVENHSIHGDAVGIYLSDNPLGLKSRTELLVAKLGFTF